MERDAMMPAAPPAPPQSHGSRLRVELFSDAVFAVAITVLVLNLPFSTESPSLLDALASRWVSFAAFGISFAIIGCLWVSHWRLFRLVEHVDELLLLVNLGLLLFIVLIPFSASTLATFATRAGAQSSVAAAIFAANLLVMGLSFGALASLVRRRHRSGAARTNLRTAVLQLLGIAGYAAAIGIAFVSPVGVVVMTGVIAAYYLAQEVASGRRAVARPAPAQSVAARP